MLAGGATVFIWKFIVRPIGVENANLAFLNIYELLPAFIVALLFVIVISLVTPKPDAEIEKEFDSAKA